jgi:diadenosine tetraphosphatase ApaH/serine/threonine PP2A family protein phosphatase
MRVGVITDIHGNTVALDSFFRRGMLRPPSSIPQGCATRACGAFGARRVKTARLARREELGAERCEWPAALPTHARIGSTLLVHASPGRDDGVGHTHRRVDRVVDGVRIVNPGSVGNPIEADLCAGWGIVDGDDIELRRVAYDRDAAIEQALACGIPEHGATAIVAHLRGERIFTDQPITVDVTTFEPPLEAKRA